MAEPQSGTVFQEPKAKPEPRFQEAKPEPKPDFSVESTAMWKNLGQEVL